MSSTGEGRALRGWLIGLSALAVVLAVIVVVVLVRGDGAPTAGPSAAPTVGPTGVPTAGPTQPAAPGENPATSSPPAARPPAGPDITVAVYYATQTATDAGTDLKLAREFRSLPDAGGPAVTALTALLAGEPLDPDYHGLWNPQARLLGVRQAGSTIEVDLSAAATRGNVGSRGAELAVQSLVYTATAALRSDAPVRILIEGEPVDEVFGAVSVRDPVPRADPLSVRLLVQVNDPNEGATVPGTFTVTGEAAVFEANLPWRLERPDGTVVQSSAAMTAEGQTFAPYEFQVSAEPGDYVLVVEEDDPSGGEGDPPMTDTKRITVR